jgi:hypothetical protein
MIVFVLNISRLKKQIDGGSSAIPQKADKDKVNVIIDRKIPGTRLDTDAIHVGQEPERWPSQAVVPHRYPWLQHLNN